MATNVDLYQQRAVLDTTKVDVLLRFFSCISVPELPFWGGTPLPGLSSRRFKVPFISREASRGKPVNIFSPMFAQK